LGRVLSRLALLLKTRLGWSLIIGISVPQVFVLKYLPRPWSAWVSFGIMLVGMVVTTILIGEKYENDEWQAKGGQEGEVE
jgi:cadmium resistance protein CadD (predicted permease)